MKKRAAPDGSFVSN